MTTQTDLVTQVAEATESCEAGKHHPSADVYHPDGHLRWPTLSRECHYGRRLEDGTKRHGDRCECDGSGRVPDVTLEKVLAAMTQEQLWDWGATAHTWFGKGPTPLEAACTALLAT